MVSSIIASIAFGLATIGLLYGAWHFSTAIGAYRRERRNKNSNSDKKLRKQYETEKKSDRYEGLFGKFTLPYIHRMFHHYVMDYVFGTTCAWFALYYIVQYTGILFLTRQSDLLAVNPFRWWFLQPVGAIVTGALSGMFINHYLLDLGAVGALNVGGRILLGVAILLPVNSTSFWVLYAVSAASALLGLLFLWGRESARSSRTMAVGYYFFINLAYYLLFLASYEVEGWLSKDWTLSLFPILDGLAILVPAIVVMTDWFYRNYGVPLFPLFLYDAYAVSHWWKTHTSSELHYLWPSKALIGVPNKHEHKHHHHGKSSVTASKTTTDTKVLITSDCNLCGYTQEYKPKVEDESVKEEEETGNGSDSSDE